MGAQIQCPHCGQQYGLSDEQVPQYAGQTITCTACQRPFTVTQDLGQSAAPPPPPPAPQTNEVPRGYPPPYPVQYATPQYLAQRSSGLAVVSVVCGALGFVVPIVPGLLGIIFGILGLRKTRDPSIGGKGMAITGLSLGAASMLMSGCLISILLPSLNRARETANRVKCASNMRMIGQALLLHANENRGAYPPRLENLLLTQDITGDAFVCPSSSDTAAPGAAGAAQAAKLSAGGHLSYVYVGQKLGPSAPAEAVLLYEPPANHGNDGGNFLFGDGHVEFMSRQAAQQIIAQIQAGQNPPRMSKQRF